MTKGTTQMTQALIVANAAAGSVDDDLIAGVEQEMAGRGDFDLRQTSSRGDLEAAVDELGDRRLIVVGGDGSVHAVASVLRSEGAGQAPLSDSSRRERETTLRVHLGIPSRLPEAIDVALGRPPPTLDVLETSEGDVVINVVHVGVGADAARRGSQ